MRGLAISSATRSKLAPDIPTMVESGFGDFVTTSINGIVAPPNTSIEIRRRLGDAVKTALASAEVQRSLSNLGRRGAAVIAGRIRRLPRRSTTALGSHHSGGTHLDRLRAPRSRHAAVATQSTSRSNGPGQEWMNMKIRDGASVGK